MHKETDIIYEAIANLEEITGLPISMETTRPQYDAIINVGNHIFYAEAKTNARKSNNRINLVKISGIRQ